MSDQPKQAKKVVMARTFASAAYLREVDKGTYMLYRDIMVECRNPKTGELYNEKTGKNICVSPFPLREMSKDDDERAVVLNSFHPTEARPLKLVEIK